MRIRIMTKSQSEADMKTRNENLLRLLLGALLFLTSLAGCNISGSFGNYTRGSGNIISEERLVSDFSSIRYGGSGEVVIRPSDGWSCVVTCDDNLSEKVSTQVENGELIIRTSGSYSATEMKIEITLPTLSELKLQGSGSGTVHGVPSQDLRINLSGSGSLTVHELESESLAVSVSGSGSFRGDGFCNSIEAKVNGSGGISIKEIQALSVNASATGSGGIEAYATESFNGVVTGSGGISCAGNPVQKSKTVTGSGRINIQ